ncbi:MAG: hypothetical protein KDH98_23760, partial [Calditrichaeota bacterium]|nr:hypothetical protein [Calditrichota bacterium]
MNIYKKWQIAVMILLLATGLSAKEWTVQPGTQLPTIRAAIAVADSGDVIIVKSGTYRESPVEVNKSVSIIGDGEVIIDGEEDHQVITV